MKKLSIKAALNEAYEDIQQKFWKIIGRFALLFGFFLLFSALAGDNNLTNIIVSMFASFAFAVFSLTFATTRDFTYERVLDSVSFRKFVYYVLASLLVGLVVIGGLIVLIVPGIIMCIRLSFTRYLVVEKAMSPMAAVKESYRLTKGYGWKLLWFGVIALAINILGAICLVVGLLFTMPLTMTAFAILYKKISAEDEPTTALSEEAEIVDVFPDMPAAQTE